jgi:hypothetical protein
MSQTTQHALLDHFNQQINKPSKWTPDAGTADADKQTWLDNKFNDLAYGGQPLSDEQKASALSKELDEVDKKLKEMSEASNEVYATLNAYEGILNDPTKIQETAKLDYVKERGLFGTDWFPRLERAFHLRWRSTLGWAPGDPTEAERKLSDPTELVERVKQANVENEKSRDALLTTLNTQHEDLKRYHTKLESEIAALENRPAAPNDAAKKTIDQMKAKRDELKTVLQGTPAVPGGAAAVEGTFEKNLKAAQNFHKDLNKTIQSAGEKAKVETTVKRKT